MRDPEKYTAEALAELGTPATGHTLNVFDQPTTALHLADIRQRAQTLVDLGPEGGDAGGQVVVSGTSEEVAARKTDIRANS